MKNCNAIGSDKYGMFANMTRMEPALFSNSHRHLRHSNSRYGMWSQIIGWMICQHNLLLWHFVIISTCQSWASQHQDGFVRPLVAVHSDGTGQWRNLEWTHHNWSILISTLIAMMNNLHIIFLLVVMDFFLPIWGNWQKASRRLPS